jgi:hypothetical protein
VNREPQDRARRDPQDRARRNPNLARALGAAAGLVALVVLAMLVLTAGGLPIPVASSSPGRVAAGASSPQPTAIPSGAPAPRSPSPNPSPAPGRGASPDPATTPDPAAAASAIVPGTVNRTSIDLVATYDVDVRLDHGAGVLRIDARLAVTNASGAGIDRIELNTITGPLGDLRLRFVRVDGVDVAATVDDQTIRVPLGGVLPDGASATVRVKLKSTLPRRLGGSNWLYTKVSGIVQASRWLPWIGLHRPFDRPNHGDPFFTAFSPRVVVRITTDRPLKIVAPGRRLAKDGLTQTFEARNVRDFPIVASPSFRVRERMVDGRLLRAYVLPGFPASTVLDQAADALRRMSDLAGDYAYDRFKIAQTAGGYALEGPGMIWIPTGMSGQSLRWNVYHEVAHQWFYAMVGSDHALDPFADEAVATYLGNVVSGIWRSTSCPEKRLDLSIYRYSNACYFGQIYVHGSRLLREVRQAMGSADYWRGIREYVEAHRFRLGSTRALLQTLQAHSDVDLTPILAPRFPSLY